MDVIGILNKYKINPDVKKDQFFLTDYTIVEKIVDSANIGKNDRVLEIGPGIGILTSELASKAKEIVAIEIDKRFKPILKKLPENVNVIYANAYKLLNDKKFQKNTKPFTKMVSSIPYSQAQNMLLNQINWPWCDDIVWLAPLSLVNKVNSEHILSAYFKAEVIETVDKSAFFPQPNTSSAIIRFKKIPDPLTTGDFDIYLRRWFYKNGKLKVKNAILEGIIHSAFDLKGIKISKNQARNIIQNFQIPAIEMEKLVGNMNPNYYFEIPKQLDGWFNSLVKV